MFFQKCGSVQELKKEYRRLAMLYHPDRGGDTATMATINSEYKRMLDILEHGWDTNFQHCDPKKEATKATKKKRKKSYYSGEAIKDFTDRYFQQGGHIFKIDAETCVYYGNGLKTFIIKEVQHKTLGTVYTARGYNKMPKKYSDILEVKV